jgi:uncharacterized membrane protein YqhA
MGSERKPAAVVNRMIAWSRYVVLVAVAGLFVAFVALMASFAIVLVREVLRALSGEVSQKELVSVLVTEADTALLATVLYVLALGLYSLFVDDRIPLPAWLQIHTLADLKELLASVVIVVLAVLFLGLALTWDGTRELLVPGLSIAAVIGALSLFLRVAKAERGAARGGEGTEKQEAGAGEDSRDVATSRRDS